MSSQMNAGQATRGATKAVKTSGERMYSPDYDAKEQIRESTPHLLYGQTKSDYGLLTLIPSPSSRLSA